MRNPEPKDIMGLLLNDDVSDDIEELEQLNNLIFCNSENAPVSEAEASQGELIWCEENDKFAIHVWKIDEKINLKFISKSKRDVSVQRLAKIALNAIMEDLKKASP